MGKVTDPWKQGAATKDASRFSDILQPAEVNDFVLQDLPEIIKTFRSWITEKCGPNVVTVIVANNIGNDSFKTVYRNSVVYSLNTSKSKDEINILPLLTLMKNRPHSTLLPQYGSIENFGIAVFFMIVHITMFRFHES